MSGFIYHGDRLDYCTAAYNDSALNERTVEVPIACRFVDSAVGEGLELGNVLSHYRPGTHRVVDLYEAGAENLDVFDLTDPVDWIVAISTVEHVRWDEEDKRAEGSGNAIRHLLALLRPGGTMLVTVPFGWQPFLDSEILDGAFHPERECSLVRAETGWVQTPTVEHRRYAASTIWAESIWVAEWVAA